jgi:hypothetical protein
MHDTIRSEEVSDRPPFPYQIQLTAMIGSDARTYALSHCVAMARHDGCLVEFLPREDDDRRLTPRVILINGKRCLFQNPANQIQNKRARRPYSKVVVAQSSLHEVDYAIFLTTVEGRVPRAFVIPKDVLLAAYFTPESRYVTLWLPIDPQLPKFKKKCSKVRYWDFQRAWPSPR